MRYLVRESNIDDRKEMIPRKEMSQNLDKYLCLMILIFGILIEGCISTQNNDTLFDIKNIKINDADNYTKRIIFNSLKKIDQNVTGRISSINIVTETPCEDASGCTINNFTSDGKLVESNIYLLNLDSHKDSCNTFEHSLYHELGHIDYFYKYGNHDPKKEDNIYQESIELYAEKYADNNSIVRKEGCDRQIAEQLKKDFKEKEKIYIYAIKIMSKWDRYNGSIPSEMYDEYRYDYEQYQDIRNQHNSALDQYKNYMIKTNTSI